MISVECHISSDELIDRVRQTTMLRDTSVHPYADAEISLEPMDIDAFQPTTLYVLKGALKRQLDIRRDLLTQGHDPFYLEGALQLRNDEQEVGLIPPVVENDHEFGPCLLDGAHRVYTARKLGHKSINVLRIDGVSPDLPISSYPNAWEEVIEYDETPADRSLKKKYRPSYDPGAFYRDLSPLNGGTRRQPGNAL